MKFSKWDLTTVWNILCVTLVHSRWRWYFRCCHFKAIHACLILFNFDSSEFLISSCFELNFCYVIFASRHIWRHSFWGCFLSSHFRRKIWISNKTSYIHESTWYLGLAKYWTVLGKNILKFFYCRRHFGTYWRKVIYISKIEGFDGGDYEECRLLECDAAWFL
jgi:hypothetical protein